MSVDVSDMFAQRSLLQRYDTSWVASVCDVVNSFRDIKSERVRTGRTGGEGGGSNNPPLVLM